MKLSVKMKLLDDKRRILRCVPDDIAESIIGLVTYYSSGNGTWLDADYKIVWDADRGEYRVYLVRPQKVWVFWWSHCEHVATLERSLVGTTRKLDFTFFINGHWVEDIIDKYERLSRKEATEAYSKLSRNIYV